MQIENKTVLGSTGSVKLMSYTKEGDLLVVNAARCSFNKEKDLFDEADERLVNFLAREKHLLPFRHPQATLRIDVPIYILRQLGKSQVGFSWSEVSRRYITEGPKFHTPYYRKAAKNVKQGSSEENLGPLDMMQAQKDLANSQKLAVDTYNKLLETGVAPEQARVVLPQSMFTTVVVTGSLLGWHNMFTQRTDPHTQRETQEYARAIGGIIGHCFPVSWRALCEHSL